MLGLGMGEMLLIAVVALVFVGPERLPNLMREAGRYYGQARRAADDLRRAFLVEADRQDASERFGKLQERRKQAQEARKKAADQSGGVVQEAPLPPGTPVAEGAPDPNDVPPDAPAPPRPPVDDPPPTVAPPPDAR